MSCSAVAYQLYCTFHDKSTKFNVDDYTINKSGYGGILNLTFGDLYVQIYVRNNFYCKNVLLIKIYPSCWVSNKALIVRSNINQMKLLL